MNLTFPTLRVLAIQLLPLLAAAQTRTMTLDEITAAGMANSKQLQASVARSAAVHAKTSQYKDSFVPAITYTGGYSRLSENVEPFGFTLPDGTKQVLNPLIPNQYTNRLSVSETVFTGFRAVNTIKASEFLERAAQLDVEKDRAELRFNLLNAAMNLYKLQEALQTFAQSLRAAQSRLTDLRNQRDQGLALDNDVLRAELAVTRIQMARTEAENALAATQFSLAVLTGLPENTLILVDSTSVFSGETDPAELEIYLQAAAQRPEVQAAANRASAAGKQVEVGKGAYYPLVSIGANLYDNRPNQRVFPPEDRFKATWDAGITLSWNLSNLYTTRHNLEEARLNQLQTQLLGEQLNESARTDIANQYYQWKSAQSRVELAEKTAAQAIENRRVIENRQAQQVASVTDLLEADAELLQAQINAVSARTDARLAYFKLLKSTGKLL